MKQRKDFRSGSLAKTRAAELEALPGWSWDPLADRWAAAVAVLRKYVDEHGTAKISKSTVFEGANLGFWVNKVRRNFRMGKLASDRVAELESIPGWRW